MDKRFVKNSFKFFFLFINLASWFLWLYITYEAVRKGGITILNFDAFGEMMPEFIIMIVIIIFDFTYTIIELKNIYKID